MLLSAPYTIPAATRDFKTVFVPYKFTGEEIQKAKEKIQETNTLNQRLKKLLRKETVTPQELDTASKEIKTLLKKIAPSQKVPNTPSSKLPPQNKGAHNAG